MTWFIYYILIPIIIWATMGVLGWAWINHCIYTNRPLDDKDSAKWEVFGYSFLMGPILPIIYLFFVTDRKRLHWGLRFK